MHPTSLAESGRKGTRRANEGPKGKWTVTYSSDRLGSRTGIEPPGLALDLVSDQYATVQLLPLQFGSRTGGSLAPLKGGVGNSVGSSIA